MQKYSKLKIYTDGASRGNPGKSSASYVLCDTNNKIVKHGSKYIGRSTNNRAEYEAVIISFQEAAKLTTGKIELFSDSKLLVNQLTGRWQVKNTELKKLHSRVKDLTKKFDSVSFRHVNRDNRYIEIADRLCNKTLDEI